MATHKKEVSITDLQQKILSDSLYNDMSNNAGLDDWIQKALDGTGLSTLAGATIEGLVANSNSNSISIKKANPSKEEEEFAQLMGQTGIQMLTDISDEQMIEALNAVSGANRKGGSLRTQIILLAHQKPSLRKELLHIL